MEGPPAFNPEMLTLAREAAGVTQSALAERIGISQSRISKFEDGVAIPAAEDCARLADALQQPIGIFAMIPPRLSGAISFYRKTTALPLKVFKRHSARMNLRWIALDRQLAGRALKRTLELPHIPVATPSDAALAARAIRQKWRIPTGPVSSVVEVIERAGCVVEHFEFPEAKLDGLAIGGGTPMPVIFLNRNYPRDRMRLTLAHELGHLVMHRELRETVEEEAWAFAAEFLMPEAEIGSQLYPLSIESLGALKAKWGVSMQAILKRASDLKRVNSRYAQFLWMRMGQLGYRTCEPFEDRIPPETPTPIEKRMNDP